MFLFPSHRETAGLQKVGSGVISAACVTTLQTASQKSITESKNPLRVDKQTGSSSGQTGRQQGHNHAHHFIVFFKKNSLPVCVFACLCLSPSLLSLALSLSVSLCHCLSLSLFACISLSLCLSMSLPLFVCFCFSARPFSFSLLVSVSPPLCLPLFFSPLPVCLFLYVSLSSCISSLTISVCVSFSLPACLLLSLLLTEKTSGWHKVGF